MSRNSQILNEIDQAKAWFHAKKVRPIWAKPAESDQVVTTLEGEEKVAAGEFLCRGEAGDVWPQKAESLNSKYEPTSERNADGWRKYVPRPDAKGVMAAKVEHPFRVRASWGELSGKAGDYIVKNYDDRDDADPEDVWIVDNALFRATYQSVDDSGGSE